MRSILLLLLSACTPTATDSIPKDPNQACDLDKDGYCTEQGDCNDGDATVSPEATEVCNGVDDDCDGALDEEVSGSFYEDRDGDGFGDPSLPIQACEAPDGTVGNALDCDDQQGASYPGNPELCDGLDNDCDGSTDEEVGPLWYPDADADGYGSGTPIQACEAPAGHSALAGDCNDADAAYNPAASEVDCTDPNDYNCDGSVGYTDADGDGSPACQDCDDADREKSPGGSEQCDGKDNDCNGSIDDAARDGSSWYADVDADGFGDPSTATVACTAPQGFVADATDCDDLDPATSPDGSERCDGLDNDCDGLIDDDDPDVVDAPTWYLDYDGDGYSGGSFPMQACTVPAGWTGSTGDCEDADPDYYPGAPETDCTDPNDYNCDGVVVYQDGDQDGWAACEDCDDADADRSPSEEERCDGLDNDCDGLTDDADPSRVDPLSLYTDADGDGYGGAATTPACVAPSGTSLLSGDCDDGDGAVYPGASEVDCSDPKDYNCDGAVAYRDSDQDGWAACEDCNDADAAIRPDAAERCDGLDNNCDGSIDGSDAIDPTSWYADGDGDGYGAGSPQPACQAAVGQVADAGDCDDGDPAIFPGATEVCNGSDDDCDGLTDDADPGVVGQPSWYLDGDGDGYAGTTVLSACTQPAQSSSLSEDCDDSNAGVSPAAVEDCNGVDDDCDGTVDEAEELLGEASACAGLDCADILSARPGLPDGLYWISPAGSAFEAWCDMTEDGGGWTLLLSANGSSTYWGNNAPAWSAAGSDPAPSSLNGQDFHGRAYAELDSDEIRLCYQNSSLCHVFAHGYGISLQEFFTTSTTYTEYSADSLGIADAGTSALASTYLSELGVSTHTVTCRWLGINNTTATSAIGLMGDWNCGCASYYNANYSCRSAFPYHDDLAVGVGLQSCYDANSCTRGGSGHAAGQTRGWGGVDNSGVRGPWYVFGR
jgi:Putative metal-binding motif